MSETHQEIEAAAKELLSEVGLPADFITSLNAGDDWSFIVKLHALVEAAVTHALVVHVAKEEAREIFANLELNNSKTGKVAFAGLYLQLESEDRRFMRSLSELRNDAVHDVRNVSMDLNARFAALKTEGKRAFMKAFAYTELDRGEKVSDIDELIARHGSDVRRVVLRSAMFLLAILQLQSQHARAAQESTKLRLRVAELLRSHELLQGTRKAGAFEQ